MKEEFHDVPPDVSPIIKRIISELNKLTVLDQQSVLELLVVRHIIKKSYPEVRRVNEVLLTVLENIIEATAQSMRESRNVHQNKS